MTEEQREPFREEMKVVELDLMKVTMKVQKLESPMVCMLATAMVQSSE